MSDHHDDKSKRNEVEVRPEQPELQPTPLPSSPSLVRRTLGALALGSALFIGACGDDKPPAQDTIAPQTMDMPVDVARDMGCDCPQPPDMMQDVMPPDTSNDAPQPGDMIAPQPPPADGANG